MYKPSEKSLWSGRIDDKNDPSSYRYHQVIKVQTVEEILASNEKNVAIVSFECDEGVRRNQGRLGAAQGSYAIKKALANFPSPPHSIVDAGIVLCEGTQLEQAQQELGSNIKKLLNNGQKTIVLGGGHETLYGHYLGVRAAIGEDKKLGILNIDAHFDLRKFDVQPSSGTMFHQLLTEDSNASYFVMGIQRYGNTQELFNRADQLGVRYIYEDDLLTMDTTEIKQEIDHFVANCDVVLMTLCMDVVAAEAAPGVSAPSAFGLQPTFVRQLLRLALAHPKVMSFDVCEVNPKFDIDQRTAKLAAGFVNEVVVNMKI